MRQIAARHDNLHYTPTLSREERAGVKHGRVHKVAARNHGSLAGWRVFFCGRPDRVQAARINALIRGVSQDDLYSDPFVPAPRPACS